MIGAGCALVAGAACSGGEDRAATTPTTSTAPGAPSEARPVYVAVGASETVGIGGDDPTNDAWPQVLARRALPPGTRPFVLGMIGATVDGATNRQLPEAQVLKPTLVTVWLNVNDLLAGVTPETYEFRLTRLLAALRAAGKPRVLVANTPPLDHLPAYLACRPDPPAGSRCLLGEGLELPEPEVMQAVVDAYNQAIERAAAATGAEVVDLHAVALAARAAGTEGGLASRDGLHPSTAGHAAVADAFAAALAG